MQQHHTRQGCSDTDPAALCGQLAPKKRISIMFFGKKIQQFLTKNTIQSSQGRHCLSVPITQANTGIESSSSSGTPSISSGLSPLPLIINYYTLEACKVLIANSKALPSCFSISLLTMRGRTFCPHTAEEDVWQMKPPAPWTGCPVPRQHGETGAQSLPHCQGFPRTDTSARLGGAGGEDTAHSSGPPSASKGGQLRSSFHLVLSLCLLQATL